jgi:hypothetical protein
MISYASRNACCRIQELCKVTQCRANGCDNPACGTMSDGGVERYSPFRGSVSEVRVPIADGELSAMTPGSVVGEHFDGVPPLSYTSIVTGIHLLGCHCC